MCVYMYYAIITIDENLAAPGPGRCGREPPGLQRRIPKVYGMVYIFLLIPMVYGMIPMVYSMIPMVYGL